ncbi:Vta1 like/Vta1 C-terminal domain containing protein [Lotmaria passim]
MSSSANLLEKVPEQWLPMVRPFLQRAREFEERQPLVSYFLRTHVAFLCMKNRNKQDKAGTAFLMTLLEALEADKAKLGAQLDGVDGRTTLTRCALMLFARADDAERTGNASMTIVRIFYTAAVLFEATEQFTEDGAMDSIAAQKCKYAKYIAARMKKALDANEPYVSPNKIEQVEGGPEAANIGSNSNFTTVPATCFSQTQASAIKPQQDAGWGPLPPPASFTGNRSSGTTSRQQDVPPPSYTYDFGATSNNSTPAPSAPPPPPPSNKSSVVAPQRLSSNNNTNTPTLPAVVSPAAAAAAAAQQWQQNAGNASGGPIASPYANANVSKAGGGNFKPSIDQMIDAQKFASRAVSALQFYDYENAKQQLISAMQILNGVHQ